MALWLIPMTYVIAGIVLGFALPRIEHAYLSEFTLNLSVASTQAFLSAAASGMMALTGIVFAIAIVMVQFSAATYSPRLALQFVSDRRLFHAQACLPRPSFIRWRLSLGSIGMDRGRRRFSPTC